MVIGTVIGNIWATRKEENLTGLKFLVVQPERLEKNNTLQPAFIAVDRIGAGLGDRVMVTKGTPASYFESANIPIDALIVGIIDAIEKERGEVND